MKSAVSLENLLKPQLKNRASLTSVLYCQMPPNIKENRIEIEIE